MGNDNRGVCEDNRELLHTYMSMSENSGFRFVTLCRSATQWKLCTFQRNSSVRGNLRLCISWLTGRYSCEVCSKSYVLPVTAVWIYVPLSPVLSFNFLNHKTATSNYSITVKFPQPRRVHESSHNFTRGYGCKFWVG